MRTDQIVRQNGVAEERLLYCHSELHHQVGCGRSDPPLSPRPVRPHPGLNRYSNRSCRPLSDLHITQYVISCNHDQVLQDRETERIYSRSLSRLPKDIQPGALRKLRMLNNSRSIRDLCESPGNRLKKLRGDREGQYSIRINDQWRICFQWDGSDAWEVEITDYH